jgi:hypothetical protein
LPSGYKSEWQTKGTLATALQPKLAAIAGQLFLEAYTRKLRKAVIQHLGEAPSPELNQQEADWTVALIGEPACSELGELWYVATLWKEAIDGARAEQE